MAKLIDQNHDWIGDEGTILVQTGNNTLFTFANVCKYFIEK